LNVPKKIYHELDNELKKPISTRIRLFNRGKQVAEVKDVEVGETFNPSSRDPTDSKTVKITIKAPSDITIDNAELVYNSNIEGTSIIISRKEIKPAIFMGHGDQLQLTWEIKFE